MLASDADIVASLIPRDVARIAIGVDTVEISRVAAVLARHGERFLSRVFTTDERAYAGGRHLALAYLSHRDAHYELRARRACPRSR